MRIFTRKQPNDSNLKRTQARRYPLQTTASLLSLAASAVLAVVPPAAAQDVPGTQQTAHRPAPAQPTADQTQYGNAQTLCTPSVIGNRRIPKESVLARLFSRQGNLYDPAIVERDFNSLWNTGYFENVRIERVDLPGHGLDARLRTARGLRQGKADHPRAELQGQ